MVNPGRLLDMADLKSEHAALGGWPVHRYLLVLAILVIVAGLGAALYVRQSGIHDAEALIERASRFAATQAASEIESALDEVAATTSGLAATPNLGDVMTNPEGCSLTFSGLDVFPRGHLDLIGPNGDVACSSEPSQIEGDVNYKDVPWFDEAGEDSALPGPVLNTSTGESELVFATPAEAGIIVAAFLDLTELASALQERFGGPRELEFLVIDKSDDRIVSRSIDPSAWTGAELPPGTAAWPQDSVNFQHADLDGAMRYYGSASVPNLNWSVYAGAERAEALGPATDLFRKTAVIISLGVALTLLALWVVSRRIARPIHSLQLAINGAASGAPGSIRVGGPTEIRALGDEFDRVLRAMSHELAQRRRAEEALRVSEHTYRLLFEKNPEPMWIYDVDDLSILQVNDTACEHYGYSKQEWLGMTIKDIRPPDDVPAVLESVETAGPVDHSGPWRHIRANGDVIEVEITSHEMDFAGRRGRFVMATDVTERRNLEQQLSQSQRLESLGQLAGGIAHDFNNILGVILNYSAFVQDALEKADPSALQEARDDLEQITTAAKRAASLTRRLLTFARQEIAHPQVLDPNSIVEEVDKLLRRTIGEEIVFRTSTAPDIRPVRIDPGQLQQVILNLAVNARDAMPHGGTLTVETSNVDVDEEYAANWANLEAGRYVRIRVSDTGTGMDPQIAGKIFDPFFTTKATGQGTGLGLATVHGIVMRIGGSIHVYSEPGVGTSMSVLLPATDEPLPEEKPDQVRTLTGEERVLVVEDEEAIRTMMHRILTRHGYEVMLAAGGTEAIEIASDQALAIDLVITDVVMPGMMGREVTERISELRPGTPLIYVSGYAQGILDSRGRLEPGRRLLEKPFSETQLLTAVREALDGAT